MDDAVRDQMSVSPDDVFEDRQSQVLGQLLLLRDELLQVSAIAVLGDNAKLSLVFFEVNQPHHALMLQFLQDLHFVVQQSSDVILAHLLLLDNLDRHNLF